MSTVSRILSGDRTPSIDLMGDVERVLIWPIEEQVRALQQGNYANLFREAMERRQP